MDSERFALLVTPHTATITRIAAAFVGLPDAEDAAQEALLRAWRAWPTLRTEESTRAWLVQITVNVCRTWRARSLGLRHGKTDRRQRAGLLEDLPIATLGATDLTDDIDDHIVALDLRQALQTLSADLRQVIVLRFYLGMDSTEIGELLSESPATVRSRLRRAVLQLRAALDDGRNTTPATPATPTTSATPASETQGRKDA